MTGWALSLALRGAGLVSRTAGRRPSRAGGHDPIVAAGPPSTTGHETLELEAAEPVRAASPAPQPSSVGPAGWVEPDGALPTPANHTPPAEDDGDSTARRALPRPDPDRSDSQTGRAEPAAHRLRPHGGEMPEPAVTRPVRPRAELPEPQPDRIPALEHRAVVSPRPSPTGSLHQQLSTPPVGTKAGPTAPDLDQTAGPAARPMSSVAPPPGQTNAPAAAEPRSVSRPTHLGDPANTRTTIDGTTTADPMPTTMAGHPSSDRAAVPEPPLRTGGPSSDLTMSPAAPAEQPVHGGSRIGEPQLAKPVRRSPAAQPAAPDDARPAGVDHTPALVRHAQPSSPTREDGSALVRPAASRAAAPSPGPMAVGEVGGYGTRGAQEPPPIHVRIGTVEVRGAAGNAPAATGAPPPAGFGEYRLMREYGPWRLDGTADA
jgi:hypothetical protein